MSGRPRSRSDTRSPTAFSTPGSPGRGSRISLVPGSGPRMSCVPQSVNPWWLRPPCRCWTVSPMLWTRCSSVPCPISPQRKPTPGEVAPSQRPSSPSRCPAYWWKTRRNRSGTGFWTSLNSLSMSKIVEFPLHTMTQVVLDIRSSMPMEGEWSGDTMSCSAAAVDVDDWGWRCWGAVLEGGLIVAGGAVGACGGSGTGATTVKGGVDFTCAGTGTGNGAGAAPGFAVITGADACTGLGTGSREGVLKWKYPMNDMYPDEVVYTAYKDEARTMKTNI